MLKVYHVSDLHFSGNIGKNGAPLRLLGEIRNIFDPSTDHLLVTGDVTDDGDADQYARAFEALRPFQGRLLLVPGNHDYALAGNIYSEQRARRFESDLLDRLGIEQIYFDKVPMVSVLSGGGMEVMAVGLNSMLETKSSDDLAIGELGEPQLASLEQELTSPEHASRFRLVYLHHRPQHCGLFGELVLRLRDAKRLVEVVTKRAHVVAFGHSGGAKKPEGTAWIAKDAGITPPADGVPYLLNANHSVENQQCFVIGFEGPVAPGVYPSVIVKTFH